MLPFFFTCGHTLLRYVSCVPSEPRIRRHIDSGCTSSVENSCRGGPLGPLLGTMALRSRSLMCDTKVRTRGGEARLHHTATCGRTLTVHERGDVTSGVCGLNGCLRNVHHAEVRTMKRVHSGSFEFSSPKDLIHSVYELPSPPHAPSPHGSPLVVRPSSSTLFPSCMLLRGTALAVRAPRPASRMD